MGTCPSQTTGHLQNHGYSSESCVLFTACAISGGDRSIRGRVRAGDVRQTAVTLASMLREAASMLGCQPSVVDELSTSALLLSATELRNLFKIPSDECVGVILDIFFDSTAKTLVIYREFWYFSRIFPTLFS